MTIAMAMKTSKWLHGHLKCDGDQHIHLVIKFWPMDARKTGLSNLNLDHLGFLALIGQQLQSLITLSANSLLQTTAASNMTHYHYSDVIMGAMVAQITSLTIVYSSVYSGADERKGQSTASLAFVWVVHRWPVNSPHKWPVTRKMHLMTSSCNHRFLLHSRRLPWLFVLSLIIAWLKLLANKSSKTRRSKIKFDKPFFFGTHWSKLNY